jgi:hypothetical protein
MVFASEGINPTTKSKMKTHRSNLITRDAAIAATSLVIVEKLDGINCEPTNTVNATLECNGLVEYSASIKSGDDILIAYYYITTEESQLEDLGNANWEIDGYEIV